MTVYTDSTMETVLEEYDLTKGYLQTAKRLVAHHDATEEESHLEVMEGTVTEERPNGLRRRVIDAVACEAWDEYEDAAYYVAYTEEELAAREAADAEQKAAAEAQQKAAEERAAAEAAAQAAQEERMSRLEAQAAYTAMMTDTMIAEEESDV